MHTEFASLSRAQKRYVAVLAKHRPDRDPSGIISSSFVRKLHHELLAAREEGGEKVGWPRWVFVENKTGESEGFVPFATSEELASLAPVEQTEKKVLQPKEVQVQLKHERLVTEDDFEAECRAAGINF